jgi:biopolymer transport protein ExbD
MKLNKRTKKALNLNITSLIDVMFILLLFFIVTSTFKDPHSSALDLILPSSKKVQADQKYDEVVLYIDKNNQLSFAGKKISMKQFEEQFAALYETVKEKTIVLKGDENVPYQSFVSVLDVLKLNKVEKLIIATKGK